MIAKMKSRGVGLLQKTLLGFTTLGGVVGFTIGQTAAKYGDEIFDEKKS